MKPQSLPSRNAAADSFAATSKSLKSRGISLSLGAALDADEEHPCRPPVEPLIDRADTARAHDVNHPDVCEHLHVVRNGAFGRSSAAANSVTVAARSCRRPRMTFRSGWLIALTCAGSVSAIRSASS